MYYPGVVCEPYHSLQLKSLQLVINFCFFQQDPIS